MRRRLYSLLRRRPQSRITISLRSGHEWHLDTSDGELVGVVLQDGHGGWGYVVFKKAAERRHHALTHDVGFASAGGARKALAQAIEGAGR